MLRGIGEVHVLLDIGSLTPTETQTDRAIRVRCVEMLSGREGSAVGTWVKKGGSILGGASKSEVEMKLTDQMGRSDLSEDQRGEKKRLQSTVQAKACSSKKEDTSTANTKAFMRP